MSKRDESCFDWQLWVIVIILTIGSTVMVVNFGARITTLEQRIEIEEPNDDE